MPTETVENYLKAIFQLGGEGRGVSTRELAERLDVRDASVTHMLKRLSVTGWIAYEPYRGATLTLEGRRAATAVLRRHRILESFLHRMCELPLDKVHPEAERLEHAASEEFVDALDRLMGFPTVDPHGDPIPDREGRLGVVDSRPLVELSVGQQATISRVEDGRPDALTYLVGEGLVPGGGIRVVRKLDFDGSVEVQLGRRRIMLSRELASGIQVVDVLDVNDSVGEKGTGHGFGEAGKGEGRQ